MHVQLTETKPVQEPDGFGVITTTPLIGAEREPDPRARPG